MQSICPHATENIFGWKMIGYTCKHGGGGGGGGGGGVDRRGNVVRKIIMITLRGDMVAVVVAVGMTLWYVGNPGTQPIVIVMLLTRCRIEQGNHIGALQI